MDDFSLKLLANKDLSHIFALFGVTGSVLTYAFGGWSGILELLLWFFAADYVTGCYASLKEKKGLRSTIGFRGLGKKGLMLLMVFLGRQIDVALSLDIVMNSIIYFWLANELVSILENYARCDIKTPNILSKVLAILQEKKGESQDNNTRGA